MGLFNIFLFQMSWGINLLLLNPNQTQGNVSSSNKFQSITIKLLFSGGTQPLFHELTISLNTPLMYFIQKHSRHDFSLPRMLVSTKYLALPSTKKSHQVLLSNFLLYSLFWHVNVERKLNSEDVSFCAF